MLISIWLVVFAPVGFSLVDSIPGPNTQDAKTSNCLASLSSNAASTRTIVEAATTLLLFGKSPYDAMRRPRAAFRGEVPQSNRLLRYKRQCSTVCGNTEISLCCEKDQFCATSKGIPICAISFTSTDVTPISSSQPSATEGSSSAMATSFTLTTTVTSLITTSQSTSIISATQTSTGLILTSSASETSVTSVIAASSTTQNSGLTGSNTAGITTTYSPTSTTSSIPPSGTSSAGGGGVDQGTIVGIVFGVVGSIGVVAAVIFGVRQWSRRAPGERAVRDVGTWFCGCGRSHHHNEMLMGRYP